MKCTQCGCNDLEKINFPYKSELVITAVGLVGESFQYELKENVSAQSYICTHCGHLEFFDPELADRVLDVRDRCAKIKMEIDDFDRQVLDKNKDILLVQSQIDAINEQLKDLDITIRQSNELKATHQELINKLKALKNDMQELIKRKTNLEYKLNSLKD